MAYSLTDGEDFVEIGHAGKFFFKEGLFQVGASYTWKGNTINPTTPPSFVDEVEADGASSVSTASKYPIIDNLGNEYEEIIGGRPPKRPRS